jgi:hypothetical protein
MSIGFRDHEGFHRAAMAMTAAGAAAGLAGSWVGVSPLVGGAVGAVIGCAAAERPRRAARVGLGLVMVSLGAAIAQAAGPGAALWIVAGALAIALARGGSARGWLGAAGLGALVTAAAGFAALKISGAAETASWPAWAVAMASGAAMALTCVVALVPARVVIERDPVAAALRALPARVNGEIRELADQGARVWAEVKARMQPGDAGRGLVQDGVLRLVEVAARSEKIPADVDGSTAKVKARIDELDARIAAATDEIARAQYGEARAALDDQRRYLEGIQVSRDRLVARMHNYLAALEKFRLCVIHVETASTADLEVCGKALAELEAA